MEELRNYCRIDIWHYNTLHEKLVGGLGNEARYTANYGTATG